MIISPLQDCRMLIVIFMFQEDMLVHKFPAVRQVCQRDSVVRDRELHIFKRDIFAFFEMALVVNMHIDPRLYQVIAQDLGGFLLFRRA